MMHSKIKKPPFPALRISSKLGQLLVLTGVLTCTVSSHIAWAQNYPITSRQRQIARTTAANGVPVSELAPNAPSKYVVKRGDTLWDISAKFLKSPWRWPELWGMNLEQVNNPHLIFPGQILWLDIVNGRARLRMARNIDTANDTVRLQPSVRIDDQPIAAVPMSLIEPFLSEPLIVDEATLKNAHWIIASKDGRNILGTGDRVYARSANGNTLEYKEGEEDANVYRIFRNAEPIKDPATKEVLGYEGQFVGRARLVRSETVSNALDGGKAGIPEAAALDIIAAKEEIRTGDRLLPEPQREVLNHVPHAPETPVHGLVASVYGEAISYVGQNQIITVNLGERDGITRGTVLSLISTGRRIMDKTNNGRRDVVKLPDERNGLLYIFRPFDRLSYGLVIEIKDPVKIGDQVEAPTLYSETAAPENAVAIP